MQYDPYNVEAVPNGSSIDLSFDCDTGAEKNLQFQSYDTGVPDGTVIYDLVNDLNQPDNTVHISQTLQGIDTGQTHLVILVYEGGELKGRFRAILQ